MAAPAAPVIAGCRVCGRAAMVIPGFGVLRNATPVVSWFRLSGCAVPVVAGFGVPGGAAPVVARLGVLRNAAPVVAGLRVSGCPAPVIARLGSSRAGRPGSIVDQLRALCLARHSDRKLMAERRIAGQAGNRRSGGHAAGGDRHSQDEQKTFHDALLVRSGW